MRRATGWSAATASDVAFCTAGMSRIGMREHEARQPIGQRRLADAGRAADQPGMRNAAAFVGIEQRALGLGMAEQRRGLARPQHVDARRCRRCTAPSSRATSAFPGCSRCSTIAQIRSATTSRGARPSMTTQRLGSLSASATIGLAQVFHEIRSTPPRSGRLFPCRAGAWRAPGRLRRHVEE